MLKEFVQFALSRLARNVQPGEKRTVLVIFAYISFCAALVVTLVVAPVDTARLFLLIRIVGRLTSVNQNVQPQNQHTA